jgi:cytidylate kinase
MTATITIEGKIVGQKKPLLADWLFALPTEWESPTERIHLRDLITRVVLEEVAAFKERQAEQRLLRVLTSREIVEAAAKGKVTMGGRDLDQEVAPQAAVATALQAFEDHIYYVFVDGQQQQGLDAEVQLKPNSRVTFLRLVPLAGG